MHSATDQVHRHKNAAAGFGSATNCDANSEQGLGVFVGRGYVGANLCERRIVIDDLACVRCMQWNTPVRLYDLRHFAP
jgi:hypothetical protein